VYIIITGNIQSKVSHTSKAMVSLKPKFWPERTIHKMVQLIRQVRNQLLKPTGTERGIALQTLIVTAVLVLLAVAAGVIIAAIINSSSDDLEDQSQDLDARCAPWELHDPVLEASGVGGGGEYTNLLWDSDGNHPLTGEAKPGRGGVTSSKIGCLPVCYLKVQHPDDRTVDALLVATNGNREAVDSDLKFDTSNRLPKPSELRVGVTHTRENGRTPFPRIADTEIHTGGVWHHGKFNHAHEAYQGIPWGFGAVMSQLGTHPLPLEPDSNLVIRVSSDREGCIIQDTSTKDIFLDSREG